jgi:hypothetical protein
VVHPECGQGHDQKHQPLSGHRKWIGFR